jgi:hypothetical protein
LLAERLHIEPWTAATTADKEAALIMATRALDELVRWHGRPATVTQALAWPQLGHTDCFDRVVASTIVPDVVKRATAEYALALLRETSETSGTAMYADAEEIWMPELRVRFRATRSVSARTIPPADVRLLLQCYGEVAGGPTRRLVRT